MDKSMSKQDAILWIRNLMHDIGQSRHSDLWGYEQALDEIQKLLKEESADSVEVVRCKDCKWHMDKFCNNFNVIGFDNDDFCSMGERKSDV